MSPQIKTFNGNLTPPTVSRAAAAVVRTFLAVAVTAAFTHVHAADSRAEIVDRVGEDIRYLASDELEGRGVETKGIELAAARILDVYRTCGLKPAFPDGSFRQTFDIQVGDVAVSENSFVVLKHTDGTELRLQIAEQFQPLRRGGNGKASGELFFIGYGISADDEQYDDYAGVSVAGKVLVMIRREPQNGNPDGAFQGRNTTRHSYIERKLELAQKHGAAGVVFVNDAATAANPNDDELTQPAGFGSAGLGLPFVHVKQSVVDQLLEKSPLIGAANGTDQKLDDLQAVCEHIDSAFSPVSQPLTGWSCEMRCEFAGKKVEASNLVGVLEADGDLAEETIVVGAHYDHLGYGGYGSRAANRTGEIHNGADDNATGTAAVLEIIRRVTTGPPLPRRIVFVCFSGEERGLLGSKHYVDHPVVPLEQTVAMLNYDMIGTLRNNRVEVNGVGTAREFRRIAEEAAAVSPLEIRIVEHPFAGSDHLPFFQKQIPVMFCFTGVTPRYHTPDDDFHTINVDGVVSVIDYTESLLRGIAALPKPPQFQLIERGSRARMKIPYLGIRPNQDADADTVGVPVQQVVGGSPAQQAGLQVGDSIIRADDSDIDSFEELLDFLKEHTSGDVVTLTVKRGEESIDLKVSLGAPR
ncbi:MAG: M20/M25/M40 family metallo-hydrolase [Planctomycetaceae bacterium]|nr:M20/M25/M40 family metallo-hydrolase [Planctomycetaceae bacterium]